MMPPTEPEFRIIHGDALESMRAMPDASVDAVVTDPPYGLSFMGAKWDHGVPGPEFWAEALRVAKPGAHLVAFGGTRTFHRLACAIEDAGWEIRDTLCWIYGSGFPKSLDVSKAIDKSAGAKREVVGRRTDRAATPKQRLNGGQLVSAAGDNRENCDFSAITAPATEDALRWAGWGTALKPAFEPIILARKPLGGRTVAANVLEHGTGGLNIDACRIGAEGGTRKANSTTGTPPSNAFGSGLQGGGCEPINAGRWPANLCHDGSAEVLAGFPETGASSGCVRRNGAYKGVAKGAEKAHDTRGIADAGGSAARFFYTAKASRADREDGLDGRDGGVGALRDGGRSEPRANHHPTVKPTDLMRWLCRLVTPPGGLILDPFTGSGSTGRGAMLEGFRFVGVEREKPFVKIARARCFAALANKDMLAGHFATAPDPEEE